MKREHIAQVRSFNRLVTQRAGALNEHFLGRDRPLGASRVLYEIGRDGAELRDLRARLGLDSGYLSRLVQGLAAERMITLGAGREDERVRRAELTAGGRIEVDEMNRRSDDAAAAILAPLTPAQRSRLVAAMAEVQRLLYVAGILIERADPADDAARWCIDRYCAELDRRFDGGFDPARSLSAEDDEFRAPRGVFLVAWIDGEPVACGAVKVTARRTGSLKRMWVSASVRGLGFGRRMLVALEGEARTLGFTTLRLETNRALTEARALYASAGYHEVAPFNDDPYADHWFEKKLR